MLKNSPIAGRTGASLAMVLCAAIASAAPSAPDAAAQVLISARAAYGPVDGPRLGLLVETGTEQSSGLTGHWRLAQDTTTGRMHESVDYRVYQRAEVWDGQNHWRQDHSGGVHALNSAFARANAITAMWLARWGFLRPDAAGASIDYLEARADNQRTYQRLRATPPGGQAVELWFDQNTGLLARSTWVMPIEVTTVRYEDYRRVHSAMLPFKVTTQEGDDSKPEIVAVDRAEFVAEPAQGEFSPPATPDDCAVGGGVATVPIRYDGDVVVEAMLNGKGPFGFILDTGGHDILTPDAANALGLSGVGAGESGGAGPGTLSEQYTRVERVELGGVTLRDQSFMIIPLQYNTVEQGPKPPLAGILGVELFERFAMELNYRAGTLTFRPLKDAPAGQGIPVAITFSDDQPLFSARIDGVAGDNGLDTGNSGILVVQGRWAQRNGLAERMRSGLRSASFGAGGIAQNWATRAEVEVAGIRFPHVIASYAEDQKGAFSSRTEAGNIGNQIYENFTLSFDYRRNTVWFAPQPNRQQQTFVYPGTGMGLYKQSPDSFTVTTVLPDAPAAEAGITEGDEIVTVNGVAARNLSGWDMRRIVRKPPGTVLKLDVARAGRTRPVLVTLRELLP